MKAKFFKILFHTAVLLFALVQLSSAEPNSYLWTQLPASEVNPGTTDLRGIWGTQSGGTTYMFVVGQGGNAYHYSAGIWSPKSTGDERDLNGVYGFSPSSVFAVAGSKRSIYHFNGNSWERDYSELTNSAIYSIWGVDDNHCFASGELSVFSIIWSYYYNLFKFGKNDYPGPI